jgi:GntR family transcriptional regulator
LGLRRGDKHQARYLLIAEHLRAGILAEEFAVGEQLPSQRELAERYDTTLMTVRQALTVLEGEGLIVTEHGVGTFVADPTLDTDTLHLLSFRESVRRPQAQLETRVLGRNLDYQDAEVAALFGLPKATSLALLERVRLLGAVPIVYQRSILPPQLALVVETYTPDRSLYEQVRRQADETVSLSRELVQPTLLNQRQAVALGRSAGEPAFVSRRISLNGQHAPAVYDEAILLGERFVVAIERVGRQSSVDLQVLDDAVLSALTLLREEL